MTHFRHCSTSENSSILFKFKDEKCMKKFLDFSEKFNDTWNVQTTDLPKLSLVMSIRNDTLHFDDDENNKLKYITDIDLNKLFIFCNEMDLLDTSNAEVYQPYSFLSVQVKSSPDDPLTAIAETTIRWFALDGKYIIRHTTY